MKTFEIGEKVLFFNERRVVEVEIVSPKISHRFYYFSYDDGFIYNTSPENLFKRNSAGAKELESSIKIQIETLENEINKLNRMFPDEII